MTDSEFDADLSAHIDRALLWVLMKHAAPIIAGKPCLLKQAQYATDKGWGFMSVNMQGTPVVSLSQGLKDYGDREYLRVYLHELAHVKFHSQNYVRSTIDQESPDFDIPVNTVVEDQADKQANEWLEYGDKHRDQNKPYANGVILALVDYYTKGKK